MNADDFSIETSQPWDTGRTDSPVNAIEALPVSEYLEMAREHIQHFSMPGLWIRGEVSNLARPGSGHIYFTLKDDRGQLRCAMFRGRVNRMLESFDNGSQIFVSGQCDLYTQRGDFQFIVSDVRRHGLGDLLLQREKTRLKLAGEGLFSRAKRPMPAFPSRIGVVTSPTGAALHDIRTTIARRWPAAQLLLEPAIVQGKEAPNSICVALQNLYTVAGAAGGPQCIIVGRGGGSIEDLWAFNLEDVVRKVAESPVPIISAVGHEIDEVLTDFAADLRAPTPTAAAEMATPDQREVRMLLQRYKRLVTEHSVDSIYDLQQRIDNALRAIPQPTSIVRATHQQIDWLRAILRERMQQQIATTLRSLGAWQTAMENMAPQKVLERGYSIVEDEHGVVRSAADFGTKATLHFLDGEVHVRREGAGA